MERLVPEFDPHTLLAQFAIMRFVHQLIVSVTLAATLAAAFGASITGNVKGPDSKPFMGAFVAAENTHHSRAGRSPPQWLEGSHRHAAPNDCRDRPHLRLGHFSRN